MILIIISLAIPAGYCGYQWLFRAYQAATGKIVVDAELEEHTFHLGLCFILAAGFLGLLLK